MIIDNYQSSSTCILEYGTPSWAFSRYFFPACCLVRFAAFLSYVSCNIVFWAARFASYSLIVSNWLLLLVYGQSSILDLNIWISVEKFGDISKLVDRHDHHDPALDIILEYWILEIELWANSCTGKIIAWHEDNNSLPNYTQLIRI